MSAATPTLTGCARAETTTKSSVEANDDATAGVEGLRRRSASSPLEQAPSTTSVDPDAISGDDERLDGAQGGAPPQRAFLSALEGEKGAPSRGDRDDAGMTDCNICFEVACDPVVTQCGHLYCWSCIYKWLQVFNEAQLCPVCKAGVCEELVIPLYGRGTSGEDPRHKKLDVPMRPSGLRLPAQAPRSPLRGDYAGGPNTTPFMFRLESLLGLGTQFATGVRSTWRRQILSPEQEQQSFLSRLLLLLGTFVIMCLLVF